MKVWSVFFFFQAEDGIRDAQESRGLGDVYKRQLLITVPASLPLSEETDDGICASKRLRRSCLIWSRWDGDDDFCSLSINSLIPLRLYIASLVTTAASLVVFQALRRH
eukprot:TRINITY_DN65418_c0_g1_i1.p1 TRINITY_DN65418_c0_g1~~TRINITY_DN65418_c0_g1_i1.p1  ORF type:complete len:108 (+),score=15.68 TRINITY_DN65418_c0_g1_i1:65-388(+)